MLAVGLDHDVDDVVEAGLPLRLGGHVSALLQSSWESLCAPSWAVQRFWCIISIILCDWLTLLWISRSHLRKSSMVHSADALGRRAKKMQKMEKRIFQNIFYRRLDFPVWDLYQWNGRRDKISFWETNMLGPQLKLCSLCFIQNKNSKHYHQ